jgi:hypothetical protein
MAASEKERRGGARLPLAVPVTLHLRQGKYDARTMNMSSRGFLLLTDDPLPPDTQFSVEMTLPETEEVLLAECEVAWVSEEISIQSEVYKGMGVRLLGFQYANKEPDSTR